jgi:hypothetical protein
MIVPTLKHILEEYFQIIPAGFKKVNFFDESLPTASLFYKNIQKSRFSPTTIL